MQDQSLQRRTSRRRLIIERRARGILPRIDAAHIEREIAAATTVVVSFPKAGRSWLCFFLARYVAECSGEPFDVSALDSGLVLPPLCLVHDHMDVHGHVVAPARLLNEELLMRRRVVVLARDPRDSLVSYWHQKRVREGRPVPDTLAAFARSPVYGIERVSEGTSLLLDLYDRHPGDRLLVFYEQLCAEPERGLREVLAFVLAGRPLHEAAFRAASVASRFESMRGWERRLSLEDSLGSCDGRFGRLCPGPLGDAHFKVRRGEPGSFEREMAPALRRWAAARPHTGALLARLDRLRAGAAGARHDEHQVPAAVARA